MRGFLVVVAVVGLLSPAPAHAMCIRLYERIDVANTGAAVPADGGLVIETRFDGRSDDTPDRDKWTMSVDGKAQAVVVKALAPGLEVLLLPAAAQSVELREDTTVLGAVTRATSAVAMVPAPKLVSMTSDTWTSTRGSGARITATVAQVPADAIALIAFDAKTGKARSFGRVEAGVATIDVYSQGRCSALPDGTVLSRAGERIVARWVDRYGRLSPASKPVTIRKLEAK
jgi:hypothetical protein